MTESKQALACSGPSDKLLSLLQRLHAVEDELEEFVAGSSDAVLSPLDGTPVLLRSARQEMMASVSRYRKLIQSLSGLVLEFTPDGEILYVNDLSIRLTGWSAHELLNRSLWDTLVLDAAEKERISIALRSGELSLLEVSFRRRDGSLAPFKMSSVNRYGSAGELRHVTAIAIDLSERRLREEKSRRLDSLVEAAEEAILTTDLEGTITSWNRAAEAMFGFKAEEIEGRNVSLIVPPDRREEQAAMIATLRKNEPSEHLETERLRKDGTRLHVRISARPIQDAAGTLIGAQVVQLDLSKLKGVTQALKESLLNVQTLIRASPLAMIVTDENYCVQLWNPAAERMLGWSAAEVVGTRMPSVPEDKWPEAMEHRRRMRAGKELHGHETQRVRKDGTRIEITVSAAPLTGSSKAMRYLAVYEDITEKVQLRRQLLQSQKMEAVGRLAGGVAHDFNNILTVILGHAEFIADGPQLDPQTRGDLEQILKAANRASSLTRQLLAFSRRNGAQAVEVDLNAIVRDMEKMLRRLIGEDLELSVELDANLAKLQGDAGQMDQVLMNLAVNARDAMPGGGKLTIATANGVLSERDASRHQQARSGPCVCLSVTDTGHGMSPQVVSRIFEPFFTTKEKGKGTGLGLATVYAIAERHGGTIRVHSQPGKGSRFEIYFPVGEPGEKAAGESTISLGSLCGSETILLVEDEAEVRFLAHEMLQRSGYRVVQAKSADEARRLASSHAGPIHLLLTDVVMPSMSGPALAARLLALHPELRVLLMTGYSSDSPSMEALSLSNFPLLMKPFSNRALLEQVRKVLDADAFEPPAKLEPVS